MKPIQTLALCALAALWSAATGGLSAQEKSPIVPVGTLSAYPTIVQTGTHPTLTWAIAIPESAGDVVPLNSSATLNPSRDLYMDIRVLGAPVGSEDPDASGGAPAWSWDEVELQVNYNGGGWETVFAGIHEGVVPNAIVHTETVAKNSKIDFAGRRKQDGEWTPWVRSTTGSPGVVALYNNDDVPSALMAKQQASSQPYLMPFINSGSGKIKLGPREVLLVFELTHPDPGHGGFDLQESALLVTFYDKLSGNRSGLGDDTNPGQGGGTENSPNEGTDNPNQARGNRAE